MTFNLEFNTQVNYHSNTKEEKASSDSSQKKFLSDELFPGKPPEHKTLGPGILIQ